jgi:hypothetical protein
VGAKSRVCLSNKTFSANQPYCEVNCSSHCEPWPNVTNGNLTVQLKKKVILRLSVSQSQKRKKVVLRNVCAASVKCYGREKILDPPKLYCGEGTSGWVDYSGNTSLLECACAKT